MTKVYTEQLFNDIFEGIKTKLDFKRLKKFSKERRYLEFKKLISQTNLKHLQEKNKRKLYTLHLANITQISGMKLKNLKAIKTEMTKEEKEELKELEKILDEQKTLSDFDKKLLSNSKRTLTKNKKLDILAEKLQKKDIIVKFTPEKKVSRGRTPTRTRNTLKLTKKGYEGKTKTGLKIKLVQIKIRGKKRILVFKQGKKGIHANLNPNIPKEI